MTSLQPSDQTTTTGTIIPFSAGLDLNGRLELVKVTVLYNLPAGTDEDEFVRWRTTRHHAANVARPGVIRSDFYRVIGTPMVGEQRPASDHAPYRFVTESWWESYEAFVAGWNDPAEQSRLVPAVAKIADALFLVAEEIQTYVRGDDERTAG